MTATRAPLGQGEVMHEPPCSEAECAHRTRIGGRWLREASAACQRGPAGNPEVLDTDDGTLASHPVWARRIELLHDEIELDWLHCAEHPIDPGQDAHLAEAARPPV